MLFKMAKLSQIYLVLIEIFITLLVGINFVESRGKHAPLLVEDGSSRRNNRPAECQFGKSIKELGSTWFADLGPPFGIMYCIKCECVPVQKKRRIVARAQCRNIKNECPVPTCDEPVLLPGRCCKTCSGDSYSPDMPHDVAQPVTFEEEERSMKHFAALLTGRTSHFIKRDDMLSVYSSNNPQNIIATGRFIFHKKNLYYSFIISDKAKRPQSLQFVDHAGSILEEHTLTMSSNGPFSVYQNATGKICGVWRRVPRDYRRLLREDQMSVILQWGGKFQAELALVGQIGKYPALATELFSSLLEPAPGTNSAQMAGAGGTAIVSTNSGVSSIHITVVFNGVFSTDEIFDVPLNIRLESLDKKVIISDIQRIKKPAHDINVVEISSPVTPNDLRLLSRGRLTITVESKNKPQALRIQGNIYTRVACDIFQTLLSSNNPENNIKSSGLVWMYINKDGSLVYNLQTDNLSTSQNPIITLVDDSGKRRTELEDLTPTFTNNFATGVIERLSPKVLEPLYNSDLAINIATEVEPNSLIKGRLMWRPVADARDTPTPNLITRTDHSVAPSNMVGMAWLAVDTDCTLHYELALTGAQNQNLQLYLEEQPIIAPGAPVTQRLLEDFTGNLLEGFSLMFSPAELGKLETSVVSLEIFSKDKNETLLKSRIKSIKVPVQCLPFYTDNNVPNYTGPGIEMNDNSVTFNENKCYHSDRFYDEGQQWSSTVEPCTKCSCVDGRVKCDQMKCPPLKCKHGESQLFKGECCPSCIHPKFNPEALNASKNVGCVLGDQLYLPGTSWHPYLPPNGFDECAICACDPITLTVHCPRQQCPPLSCSEKDAYRPDKKACCKKCPEYKSNPNKPDPETQADKSSKSKPKSEQEIITNGGCKMAMLIYENGQEWHPVVASHGEQKCVQCRCKDGEILCNRKRCTRSVCNNKIVKKNRPSQENDECCNHQCRRQRRHHQNSKRLRKENAENLNKTKS